MRPLGRSGISRAETAGTLDIVININKKRGVNLLEFSGRMTLSGGGVEALRKSFNELIAGGERTFLFDLSEVRFMDSASIGELVSSHKRVSAHGGTVKVVTRQDSKVRDLLAITHLDKVLEVFVGQEEALDSFEA